MSLLWYMINYSVSKCVCSGASKAINKLKGETRNSPRVKQENPSEEFPFVPPPLPSLSFILSVPLLLYISVSYIHYIFPLLSLSLLFFSTLYPLVSLSLSLSFALNRTLTHSHSFSICCCSCVCCIYMYSVILCRRKRRWNNIRFYEWREGGWGAGRKVVGFIATGRCSFVHLPSLYV